MFAKVGKGKAKAGFRVMLKYFEIKSFSLLYETNRFHVTVRPVLSISFEVDFPTAAGKVGGSLLFEGASFLGECLIRCLERHETGDKDRNYVNGTQISIGKFPPGKRDYLFRNSVCSGKFPGGRTKKQQQQQFYLPHKLTYIQINYSNR